MNNSGQKFLVDSKEAARLCSISPKTFYSLDQTGAVPQSIRLKSCRRWSVEQLKIWCVSNCPARDSVEWQALLQKLQELK